jgi:hypothetical protein
MTWTVDGTRIAGYAPTTRRAKVKELTDAELKKEGITFYWVHREDDSIAVTYKYCVDISGVGNQCSMAANASFNVTGPSSVNLFACEGNVSGCSTNGSMPPVEINLGPVLQFAGPGLLNGMMFTASDDPSSPPGQVSFVQLLNNYDITYTFNQDVYNAAPCPVSYGSGLDTSYPYQLFPPASAIDYPDAPLFFDDTEVTASFQANMYLLWTSIVSGSIPVPLGSITWGWYGDAVQNLSTQTWSINPNSANPSQGTVGSFVQSSTYPQWGNVVYAEQGGDPRQPNYNPCIR